MTTNQLKRQRLLSPAFLSGAFGTLVFSQLAFGQPATVKRPIFDPILGRNAFYVDVPQNWQFAGAMVPGSACESFPMAVFRASSPDGLTGVYMLPRLDWSWVIASKPIRPVEECIPWKRKVSAKEILTLMVPMLNVAFEREGDPAVIAELNAQAKRVDDDSNAKPGSLKFSTDVDRFVVRYEIDHHQIEEVLEAMVHCSDNFQRDIGWHIYKCASYVSRRRAPFGKLQEQASTLIAVRGSFDEQWNSQWMAAWTVAMQASVNGLYGPQTTALLEAGKRAGDARKQEHQAYMNSMQIQADKRNIGFVEGQYRRQHASDDFVDHILDCTRLQNGVSVGYNCPNRQTAP